MKKPKASRRTGILVLGMHRSGTSVISGVLNRLGADIPRTPMPAHDMNPKGFFESQQIYDLHEKLLSSAGTAWNDWQPFNPGWFESARADEFQSRAQDVLAHEFGESRLFVLKDPRICRLLPFWLSVFKAEGISPAILNIHRNPLEVAASLHKRDHLDQGYAHLLWLRHVLDGEHDSRALPRYFTGFEQVMSEWPRVIDEAQKKLKLRWPRLSDKVAAEIDDFLTPDLKHHQESAERVKNNPMLSVWLRDTLEIMERWSAKGENVKDQARLDEIRAELNATGPTFGQILQNGRLATREVVRIKTELAQTGDRLATLEAELATATRAHQSLDEALVKERANAAQALASAQDRAHKEEETAAALSRIKVEMVDLKKARSDLETRLAQQHEADKTALAEARKSAEAAEAGQAETQQRLGALEKERNAARDQLETITADLAGAIQARADLDAALVKDRAAAAQTLAAAENRARKGEGLAEERAEDLSRAKAEVVDLEDRLKQERQAAEAARQDAEEKADAQAAEMLVRDVELRRLSAEAEAATETRTALEAALAAAERRADEEAGNGTLHRAALKELDEARVALTAAQQNNQAQAAALAGLQDRLAEEQRQRAADLERQRAQEAKLASEATVLERQRARMENDAEARAAELVVSQTERQRALNTVAQLEEQLKTLSGKLEAAEGLKDDLKILDEKRSYLESALAQRTQEAHDWAKRSKQVEGELEAFTNRVAMQRRRIDELEQQRKAAADARIRFEQALVGSRKIRAEQDDRIASLDAELKRRLADAKALETKIATTETTLREIMTEKQKNDIQLVELMNVRNSMIRSHSWRLTAPVRWLSGLLRGH